jgi:Beta-galactosidase
VRARSSRHRAGVLTLLALALVLVAGLAAWPSWRDRAAAPPGTTTPAVRPAPAADGPTWGMAGAYTGIDMADLRRRGARLVLLELAWSKAEPARGRFDSAYFAEARRQLSDWRGQGFQVALNYGLHEAPAWLLDRPNARFVDQHGDPWTAGDQANLVWATEYRGVAERYTAKVFAELGTGFSVVRVGGGPLGELGYPGVRRADGSMDNRYWAFDGAAARTNPVPGWKPCDPGTEGQPQRFLDWYLDALTDFQNWQVATVRAHYPGTIAVLYPSWGTRPGDRVAAVAGNLCGRSRVERGGEVQRGYAHDLQIAALTDPGAAVWGTWTENTATTARLAELADRHGRPKMGENSGRDTAAQLASAVHAARVYRLSAFLWVRAEQAYCRCNGWATIDDFEALTRT